jgi:NADH-quinone oxidoreductase subunit I
MRETLNKVIVMMKGLMIVLKHAFQKPVTLRYPEENFTC